MKLYQPTTKDLQNKLAQLRQHDIENDTNNVMHVIFKNGNLQNQQDIHQIRKTLNEIAFNGNLFR